jgi:hypothetical protein
MYSVDELAGEFKVTKVDMNLVVSRLQDKGRVRLKVQGGKVYVGTKRAPLAEYHAKRDFTKTSEPREEVKK